MLKKISLIFIICLILVFVFYYFVFVNKNQSLNFISNYNQSKFLSTPLCKTNVINIFGFDNISGCGEVISVDSNIITVKSGSNKITLYSDGYAIMGKYRGSLNSSENIDFSNSDIYSSLTMFKPKDIVFYVYQENNNNTIQQITKLN